MNPETTQPVEARGKFLSTNPVRQRWLQVPLYLGLIGAQLVYVVISWSNWSTWSSAPSPVRRSHHAHRAGPDRRGDDLQPAHHGHRRRLYETFRLSLNLEGHPDEPEWLSHVNANVLKVKLATAIIGISSIHLLKTFINAPNLTDKVLLWQTVNPHDLRPLGHLDCVYRPLMPHTAKH